MAEDWWKRYVAAGCDAREVEQLRTFVAVVDELIDRRFFRKQEAVSVTIRGGPDGLSAVSDHGDVEDLRSAILALRKILLHKEPSHLDRIHRILKTREKDPRRREQLEKSFSNLMECRNRGAAATMDVDPKGRIVGLEVRTQQEALDDLLNTQLFHGGNRRGARTPDMRGEKFRDDDIEMTLLRQKIIEQVADEYEFAVWLRDFIVGPQPG